MNLIGMPHETHLLWGTYTWILLHWMTSQIQETNFSGERKHMIDMIKDICANLPCPNCREHAGQYLKKVPIEHCQTKEELLSYIYNFHNSVNMRGKKEYQPFSIMEKYKTVNIKMMIDAWNTHFVYGNDIQRHDFMGKKRLATMKRKVNQYLLLNSHKFLTS
jgi:hypothetical protein